ncbi:MAG: 50S ribosomal protein L22 [Lentisphaerae bacterium ADurb.Bin242]|nr:MAG: 50S ribosomal protein L22 [Lentisphaerae bacterium ADurb.Bin242]
MEVRAITKYVRISPSKAAEISRLIQGKPVVEALAIVEISPRKAARLFAKTLRSAIANAENDEKNSVKKEQLKVLKASADPGPMLKRYRPKARGMAGRIRKRMSHFTVVLTDD